MKTYIGTKILKAKEMSEETFYSTIKKTPCDSVKNGREGYYVKYDNGYEAWSPKDVFETHYREITENEKLCVLSINPQKESCG